MPHTWQPLQLSPKAYCFLYPRDGGRRRCLRHLLGGLRGAELSPARRLVVGIVVYVLVVLSDQMVDDTSANSICTLDGVLFLVALIGQALLDVGQRRPHVLGRKGRPEQALNGGTLRFVS
jgi:hypothetical protein